MGMVSGDDVRSVISSTGIVCCVCPHVLCTAASSRSRCHQSAHGCSSEWSTSPGIFFHQKCTPGTYTSLGVLFCYWHGADHELISKVHRVPPTLTLVWIHFAQQHKIGTNHQQSYWKGNNGQLLQQLGRAGATAVRGSERRRSTKAASCASSRGRGRCSKHELGEHAWCA